MYPSSREAALTRQLEAERALEELAALCFDLWLPLAEDAVLSPEHTPQPEPAAVSDVEDEWQTLMDEVLLYGVEVLMAEEAFTAYRALSGDEWPDEGGGLTAAGLPSVSALRARANRVLSRRLGIDPESISDRLSRTPALRTRVSAHLESIRTRVIDAAGRVFRRTRGESAEEVAETLAPEEWRAAAEEVGRTQTTAALNAGADAAASVVPVAGLEQEWVAIPDFRTREAHDEADGQVQPPGSLFTVGGEELRWPGDPRGSYENIVNCRCRVFWKVLSTTAAAAPEFVIARADILKRGRCNVEQIAEFVRKTAGQPYRWGGPLDAPPDATMATTEKETTVAQYRSFTAVLAVIGTETDDGRMFADDIDLTFRDFPLPLLWQKQSAGGHYNSYTVGVIEDARVEGKQVLGNGYMLGTAEAEEAAEQIEHGVTGPSVDLGAVEWELRDAEGNAIDWERLWDEPDLKIVDTVLAAKVLAATLVATPAFGDTSITLGEMVSRGEDALVAAAAMPSPQQVEDEVHPAEHFTNPNFTEPTHPHMTDDRRIQGHLAAWNVCHVGIQDRCVLAPRSLTDYAWFLTSPPVKTDDGGKAKVGRLTVGGGHAAANLSAGPAVAHYDDVGTCFALVTIGEDEHGIWFSGVPAPGVTPGQLAKGLAAPLSGDWRRVGGNLELVAALSVNTPGFPLVASGATDEQQGEQLSLIASLGPCRSKEERAEAAAITEQQLQDFAARVARETVAAVRQEDARAAQTQALFAEHNRAQAAALFSEHEKGR